MGLKFEPLTDAEVEEVSRWAKGGFIAPMHEQAVLRLIEEVQLLRKTVNNYRGLIQPLLDEGILT